MSITIHTGGLIRMDPEDVKRLRITWDEHFESDAELATVGTFTVEAIRPAEETPTLTVTNPLFVAGNRAVDFTVSGGTPKTKYRISHAVITTESPAQTRERSFEVQVLEL